MGLWWRYYIMQIRAFSPWDCLQKSICAIHILYLNYIVYIYIHCYTASAHSGSLGQGLQKVQEFLMLRKAGRSVLAIFINFQGLVIVSEVVCIFVLHYITRLWFTQGHIGTMLQTYSVWFLCIWMHLTVAIESTCLPFFQAFCSILEDISIRSSKSFRIQARFGMATEQELLEDSQVSQVSAADTELDCPTTSYEEQAMQRVDTQVGLQHVTAGDSSDEHTDSDGSSRDPGRGPKNVTRHFHFYQDSFYFNKAETHHHLGEAYVQSHDHVHMHVHLGRQHHHHGMLLEVPKPKKLLDNPEAVGEGRCPLNEPDGVRVAADTKRRKVGSQ